MSRRAPTWNQVQCLDIKSGYGAPGPPGPPGPAAGQRVFFTFATSSPTILQALVPGNVITRVTVFITEAFDVAASVKVGTFAEPGLFVDSTGVDLTVEDVSLDDQSLYEVDVPDSLVLTIAPNGATQGAGLVYYQTLT